MKQNRLSYLVMAVVFMLLPAGSSALAATTVDGDAARSIGGPPGGFVIPAHATASFTNNAFNACNNLSWGYQLDFGPNVTQATKPAGCFAQTAPDVTIGPFATPHLLRVFLSDLTCGDTYYSDRLPVDHVIISGSNPYVLRFADSGGFCERRGVANNFQGYNFTTTLTISKTAEQLLGDLLNSVQGVGPGNSLTAKVEAIQQHLANGNINAACGQLQAFINEVNAQSGKSIPVSTAAALVAAAMAIQTLLSCP